MRIILNTFGSFGDIHPYIAIAMELQRRGHEPVIATMEIYREKIEGAGLQFVPVRPNIPQPREQDEELIRKIMEPRTGPRFLTEGLIFPAVRESYEDLLKAVAGADLLVTHPAAPAGPLIGRKTGMPWLSTVLAPFSFISAYDPPVPPYWQWTKNLSLLGPGVMRFLLNLSKSTYKAKAVTDFRNELGLPDTGNPMFEGQHSPARVLALFSEVKLGTSRTLYRKNYVAPRIATELNELFTQPAYARRAIEVSHNLKLENGPGRAADLIEEAMSGRQEELAYASGH